MGDIIRRMSEGEDDKKGYGVEKFDDIQFEVTGVLEERRDSAIISGGSKRTLTLLICISYSTSFLPLLLCVEEKNSLCLRRWQEK